MTRDEDFFIFQEVVTPLGRSGGCMSPVLVVGSVALDTVYTPYGAKEGMPGGSGLYFSAAASLWAPVRVVGVVGEDFPSSILVPLKQRGVDLSGLRVVPGRTFRWVGEYGEDPDTRRTLETQLNVFQDFRPELPPSYRDTPFVFLANIDPELQLAVLEQVEGRNFVACDTMDFWIRRKKEAVLDVLSRSDMAVLNEEEARELSERRNLLEAAEAVAGMGPRWIVVKRGEHGAVLLSDGRPFLLPAFPVRKVVDPTGAGDTFAGGMLGYLARADEVSFRTLRRAMAYGTVVASFCVEGFGLEALIGLTLEDVEERLRTFRKMLKF